MGISEVVYEANRSAPFVIPYIKTPYTSAFETHNSSSILLQVPGMGNEDIIMLWPLGAPPARATRVAEKL